MSEKMILAGASDVDAVIQEFVEKEESEKVDVPLGCVCGLFLGGAFGLAVAIFGLIIGSFGNAAVGTVVLSFMGVGGVFGGLYGGIVKSGRRKKIATLEGEKQAIYELLAARNKIDERIGELEDGRHKLDRELAALTSDEFVEEFVRDKPFPPAPELPPAPKHSPPDVSEEPDDDFCWRLDADCA